jgi:CheY-like chemotaxis protein
MAILIVEDNLMSAKLMEHSLKKLNYHAVTASNGRNALNILAENATIELVITDVMMPEMDGIELLEKIKNSVAYSHLPVIMCTVLRDKDSIKKAAQLGCNHYLVKPYQINDLRTKVAECLKQDQRIIKSKAEIMAQYRLNEDNYEDIRNAFLQVLEESQSFLTQNDQCIAEKNLDYENIHECSVLFGTEQLKLLLEKTEVQNNANAGQAKTENPEIAQALLDAINKVINTLSK